MKRKPSALTLLLAAAVVAAPAAGADWTLRDDASSLSLVSTKAGNVAEVHRFHDLSGAVDADGDVVVNVAIDSIDTGIEVRDERMLELLFEAGEYPTATLNATVDLGAVEALAVGESMELVSEAQLMIRDQSTNLTVYLEVTRLGPDRIQVVSGRPVIVNAGQLGLLGGVEKLREVAGLPSISPAVPVTFIATFEREG